MKADKHRLPAWLQKKKDLSRIRTIRTILRRYGLNTVCEEAKCPNITECFEKKTATFMILGKTCTRNCSFCAVSDKTPEPVSAEEPGLILKMVKELGIKYAVITSVTRDDLADGGADQFCRVIELLRDSIEGLKIEVLVPDFGGNMGALHKILDKKPHVFNHNLETVAYLYPEIRPGADFGRSVGILRTAKEKGDGILIKTGIMTGFGESMSDLKDLFSEIKDIIDIITIGQYIAPSRKHFREQKFYSLQEFEEIRLIAVNMGVRHVISGPFVRSSYNACSIYEEIK